MKHHYIVRFKAHFTRHGKTKLVKSTCSIRKNHKVINKYSLVQKLKARLEEYLSQNFKGHMFVVEDFDWLEVEASKDTPTIKF